MKKEIFKKYVDTVSRVFDIDESFHRPMSIVEIQRYMNEYGYDIGHSSIIYGIGQADEKVRHDRDYFKLVKDISEL